MSIKRFDIEDSINLREKTLANGHRFAKFANVFSCQRFPLYGIIHLFLKIAKFIHTYS